jgi:hypothetical protein
MVLSLKARESRSPPGHHAGSWNHVDEPPRQQAPGVLSFCGPPRSGSSRIRPVKRRVAPSGVDSACRSTEPMAPYAPTSRNKWRSCGVTAAMSRAKSVPVSRSLSWLGRSNRVGGPAGCGRAPLRGRNCAVVIWWMLADDAPGRGQVRLAARILRSVCRPGWPLQPPVPLGPGGGRCVRRRHAPIGGLGPGKREAGGALSGTPPF